MFGIKKAENPVTNDKPEKLPGPKEIPEDVGRYMVVEMKQDPDWVWNLQGVVRPVNGEKAFYCRVFAQSQVIQAGIKVKDWTSLDARPSLILWEGYFDKETHTVRPEVYSQVR